MPPLKNLLELRCPDKEAWKNYCGKQIREKWESSLQNDLQKMKRADLLGKSPIKLDNKIDKCLHHVSRKADLIGVRTMIQIITDSLPHNYQDVRFGNRTSDLCTNCGIKETLFHLINCRKHKDDFGVATARRSLEHVLLPLLPADTVNEYHNCERFSLAVQLHPLEHIEEEINNSTQGRILCCQRKFFSQIYFRNEFHRKTNNDDKEVGHSGADLADQDKAGDNPECSRGTGGRKDEERDRQIHVQNAGNINPMKGGSSIKIPITKPITSLSHQERHWERKFGMKTKMDDLMSTEKYSYSDAEKLAHNDDSQLIATLINCDNFALVGCHVTDEGRDVRFTDGILSLSGKESPLSKQLCLSTHHDDIISNIGLTIMRNRNTLNSLRMSSGSPLVLLPPNTRRQLERAADSCKWLHAKTPFEIFPPTIDHEANSFIAIYGTDPTIKMFCIVVYEDQFTLELYLMKENETLKTNASQVGES